jgi:type I restriction enzyme S subunit
MKQRWEIKRLIDVTSLITDGDWIESRHQSEDGIRLIQTGNVGNGFFKAKDDKPHFISEETYDVLGCTEIFEGDCLVSRLPDPVGRACLIPEMDCRMITAVDCSIIRFNEILTPDFFVYYSQSSKYQNEISNKTTGTTRKRISRKNLEMIPIPVPPIAEQEKIVAELDCLSGIIEKKKQQLKELDNLAQSIFYEMFGDPV